MHARRHRLRYVSFVSGSLPTEVEEEITKRTQLTSSFEPTKAGFLPAEAPDPVNRPFLSLNSFLNTKPRPFGDDMYKLYIVRDKRLEAFQGFFFFTFPEPQKHSTKDLFVRHSTKK